jgi:menaquinone-dependent protoporphyrinogen oxidase
LVDVIIPQVGAGSRHARRIIEPTRRYHKKHNVLVAYTKKYGANAGIAQQIGETLSKAWIQVNVLEAELVVDPAQYTAITLGSAVYVSAWRKEAAAFLEAHAVLLSECPVRWFSSGPTGDGDASTLMKGSRFPEALQPVANRIKPHDIAFFHGMIDVKKLGLPEKLVTKGIKAPVGDSRDWPAITAWAEIIATELMK